MIIEYDSKTIYTILDSTKKPLIQDVNFQLNEGESLGIIGETGAGKTLVAESIMRLLPKNIDDSEARIEFEGESIVNKNIRQMLGNKIVYIPQTGKEFLNNSLTVKQQFYDALKKPGIKKNKTKIILDKLSKVGFENPRDIINKYPFELSGGMAKRVTFALALLGNPALVIADEPTSGIEDNKKYQFLDLINDSFKNSAKIIITHDIEAARKLDKIIVLCNGKVMEQGKTSEVLNKPSSPYTKTLLLALVKNGMHECLNVRMPKGECPFYSRCPLANQSCEESFLINKKEEHLWRCTNVRNL